MKRNYVSNFFRK